MPRIPEVVVKRVGIFMGDQSKTIAFNTIMPNTALCGSVLNKGGFGGSDGIRAGINPSMSIAFSSGCRSKCSTALSGVAELHLSIIGDPALHAVRHIAATFMMAQRKPQSTAMTNHPGATWGS